MNPIPSKSERLTLSNFLFHWHFHYCVTCLLGLVKVITVMRLHGSTFWSQQVQTWLMWLQLHLMFLTT